MWYCTFILVLISFVLICDTTLLWRINVNPPAYILGTAHLPYTYLWSSLSDTAKSAFYNSTHFLPEFDMTNFLSFTRLRMCMNSYMLTNSNGPPSGFMGPPEQQSPILDVYLTLEARRLRKTVTSLENVEIYCEFAKFQADTFKTNLTSNNVNKQSINTNDFEVIKHMYNCDLNYPEEFLPTLTDYTTDKTLLVFQQRLEEIVQRRDSKMSEIIDNLLKNSLGNDRFFFGIGYLHLMSSNGIIAKLKRDYKYSITRLCSDPLEFRAGLRCQGPSWCD